MGISLMNGLSALGSGVATYAASAGLEAQKAALAQQQTILADHLATVRETGLQEGQQTFTGAQNTLARQSAANLATQQQAATTSNVNAQIKGAADRTAAEQSGLNARTQATINAPPDTYKLLHDLDPVHYPMPSANGTTPNAAGSSPAGGSPATGAGTTTPATTTAGTNTPATNTAGTNTAGTSAGASTPASGGSSGASTTAPGQSDKPYDPSSNPIVAKALGLPIAGSEDAIRRGLADDVNNDPAFRYKTAGQKGAEVENRIAVAKGVMMGPDTQSAIARGIASYQISPITGNALRMPGAPDAMAKVLEINPDYQESRFPEINKAMTAFSSGAEGTAIKSLDVGVQHLDVIDQAGQNLGNTNIAAVNAVKNAFQRQFGSTPPTTFDGLKQLVGTEVGKAVSGGLGSADDRNRLVASLNAANSPAQLQDVTNGYRALMAGQLDGLKTQYEDATGFKSGPFAFENKLGPAAIKELRLLHPGAAPDAGTTTPPSGTTGTGTPTHPPLPPGFRVLQ